MADIKSTTTASLQKISLVIPCYNESARVNQMLEGLREFSRNWKKDFEIIIVDDGSKDDTSGLIEQSELYKELSSQGKFKLIKPEKNQGKGFALREGVLKATGTHVLTLDADMSTRPTELNNWLATHKLSNSEILIGSRELKTSKVTERKSRNIIGKLFNLSVRFFTPLKSHDTQCGFKLYPTDVAKNLFSKLSTSGWAHDVELLYHAHLDGIKIIDMPVTWKAMEGSKISVGVDGIKMFFQVMWLSLQMKFNWFFISPFSEMKNAELNKKNQPLFRFLFATFCVFLFFLMTTVSFHYGITGDDLDQKVYGEKVLNFYTSFGKDTSCLNLKVGNKENLYLYGGLFSMISAAANRYIGGLDEYDMRHLINAIAGFFAILFTGLLARRLGNWLTGFLALVLLASWPQFFGQSMNNPKDIPFALTYILTIYFLVKLVSELPRPSTRTWAMSAVSIALAINIRVGGLLLIGMLFAFVIGTYILSTEKRKLINTTNSFGYLFKRLIFVALAGYFGGLIFWPYGLMGPMSNPFIALKEQTNFAMGIGMLFEGKVITSKEIPWYYIPKWLEITTPLVILIAALAQLALWYFSRKKFSSTVTLLIIFATLFPWTYAAYQQSPLYDGLRQFLFMIPLIAVLASLTWSFLITGLNQKIVSYIAAVAFVIGIAFPLRFAFANHPNEYVYFNEMIGGIKGAYGKFETDYYMNSVRKTVDWFKQSEIFKNATKEKKILLATNAADPINWYFRNDTDKVTVVYTKWNAAGNPKTRTARDWDYGIYYSRNVEPGMLIAGTWPSDKAIYKNEADGVPLSCVIERKNKSDLYGYREMQRDSLAKAEYYFEDALKYNPQNEEVTGWMIQTKLNLKKTKEALTYAQKYLTLIPDDDQAYMMLGVCYAYTGDLSNAEFNLLKAVEMRPTNFQAYQLLSQLYQQKGDKSTAQSYMNKAQEIKQQLQEQQQQ